MVEEPAFHVPLRFTLNGLALERSVPANRLLADLVRDDLGCTGTKVGCSRGVCGACTLLVDGRPVASCSTFAFQIDGCTLTSIEGLAQSGVLDVVQQTFIDHAAFQCGYCTAGMVLLTKALLAQHPDPERATIVEWMSSNVCRCTGYAMIIEAVEDAARRLQPGPQPELRPEPRAELRPELKLGLQP